MSTVRLLVALTLCAHALATTSELAATFYPYTAEEELALAPANWHPELGSANSSQVTEWLTALQQLETSATGHVNYITSVCSIESNCTRALEVCQARPGLHISVLLEFRPLQELVAAACRTSACRDICRT